LEGADVKNKFVGTPPVRICIKNLVVRAEAGHDVIGIKKSYLGRVSQASSTCTC